MSFSPQQIKAFAHRIWKEDFHSGEALDHLTPRLRRALMAESVFAIFRGQASDTIVTDALNDTYVAVEAALVNIAKNPNLFD